MVDRFVPSLAVSFLLALLGSLPVAAAVPDRTSGFGTVVDDGDVDFTAILSAYTGVFVSFADDDGDGALDADEPVYLNGLGSEVRPNSVRLANPPSGFAVGSLVRGTQSDAGLPLTVLPGDFGLLDFNGDAVLSSGDTLLYDSNGDLVVSLRDVLLTGPSAGSLVGSGFAGLNQPIEPVPPPQPMFLDRDGTQSLGRLDSLVLDFGAEPSFLSPMDAIVGGVGFGSLVDASDDLAIVLLGPTPLSTWSFHDTDGDGTFEAAETAYLSQGITAAFGDVRLSGPGIVPGSRLDGGSSDFGIALTAFPGDLAFIDSDGDGVPSLGDPVILDTNGDLVAGSADLLLSGNATGPLGGGSPATGSILASHPGVLRAGDLDADGMVDTTDLVAVDTRGNGALGPLDLLLAGSQLHGEVVGEFAPLAPSYLHVGPHLASFGFLDDDGDGLFDLDEPLYLASMPTTSVGDVRVANPPSGQALGEQVRGSSPDFGALLTALPAGLDTIGYADLDGDGRFGGTEVLVADLDQNAVRSIGDLVLSGFDAGTLLGSGSPGLALPITPSFMGGLRTYDSDGDGSYSLGDRVYWDTGSDGVVNVNDVRLSGPHPGIRTGAGGSSTTGTSGTSSSTTSTTSTTSSTTSEEPTCVATTATPTATTTTSPAPLPPAGEGGPFPPFVLTVGATNVVTLTEGEARSIPLTVAARGTASLMNARLVVDDADGLSAYADPLVKTVNRNGEQTFYLHLVADCLDGAATAGHSVVVHVAGRNGATQAETIQVLVVGKASGGAEVSGIGLAALAAGLLALALVTRRRLA